MCGPYRGKLLEFGESVLAHLPEVRKGSGDPAPKLDDRWKSAVWLGQSDLTDEYLVTNRRRSCVRAKRTTTRRAQLVRSKTSSSCRHTTETEVDDSGHPLAAASLAFPPAAPEVPEDEKEEDEEMQGEPSDTKMTPGASSSSRGEKRTEAQEATSVKERVTMTSSTEKGTATFADEPVKRRHGEIRHEERRRAHVQWKSKIRIC